MPAIPDKLDINDDAARPFMGIEVFVDGVKFDYCYAYDKTAGTADGWKTEAYKGGFRTVRDEDDRIVKEHRTGVIETRWPEERSNAASAPTESSTIAPASAANRIR